MKICEWCENEFSPTVSYQIYCSPECRSQATKIKIAEKQAINKRRKRYGKDRKCARGCGTILSSYNDVNYCENYFKGIRSICFNEYKFQLFYI